MRRTCLTIHPAAVLPSTKPHRHADKPHHQRPFDITGACPRPENIVISVLTIVGAFIVMATIDWRLTLVL